MVFQEPMTALNPVQTIGHQVAETILIHEGTSKVEAMSPRRRDARPAANFRSPRFPLDRYPHELSRGDSGNGSSLPSR